MEIDVKKEVRGLQKGKLVSGIVYPEIFDLKKSDSVLDVGCGVGPQAIIWKGRYKEILGVDVTQERLDIADAIMPSFGVRNFKTLRANVEQMPLPDKSFDKVLAIDVIEHVEHPEKFLKELSRVLKDDGQLLITFPAMHDKYLHLGSWFLRNVLRRKNEKKKRDGWHPHVHQYDYNVREWQGIFKDTGWKLIRSRATTMVPPFHYFGLPRFWFSNKIIHLIDRGFCVLPVAKYYGQSVVAVYKKN